MAILILDDAERPTAALFASQGFTVSVVRDAHEADAELRRPDVEALVIEVPTPDAKTIRLCTRVRAAHAVPIVVLTGASSEAAIVNAYAAGVDAVLTHPIGSFELVARVRALLRRVLPTATHSSDTLVVGPVTLDRASRELFVEGKPVTLPRREFDIAERLMRDAGRVVLRDTLIRDLWGTTRDSKTLDVQVGRLRARLALLEGRKRIVTVRGVGYRFLADDEVDDAESDHPVVAAGRGQQSPPVRSS